MTAPAAWSRRVAIIGPCLGTMLVARPADAHLVTTGLGPVYDGIVHLLASPEDWLAVAGLALLAGLHGPRPARWALPTLPTGWLVGAMLGRLSGIPVDDVVPAVSLVALGGLVAADAALPPAAMGGLAALVGLAHGYANGAAMPLAVPAMLAIAAGVFVLFALVVAIVLPLRARGGRIGIRVLGSWIAAVGLLLLGWTLRRWIGLPTSG